MSMQQPFFTDDRPIPNLLVSGGGWCPMLLPWFYVSIRIWRDDRYRSEVLMIPTSEGLKMLLTLQNSLFKVITIDYVTPDEMNGSDGWRMERVLEISDLINAFGWSIQRCKVQGGRIYRGLALEHDDEWKVERLVYSQP